MTSLRNRLLDLAAETRLYWRLAHERVLVLEEAEASRALLDEARAERTAEAVLFREIWKEIESVERIET